MQTQKIAADAAILPSGQPRNLQCEALDFPGCIEGGDAGADCPSLQRPGRLMGQRRAVQAGTDNPLAPRASPTASQSIPSIWKESTPAWTAPPSP